MKTILVILCMLFTNAALAGWVKKSAIKNPTTVWAKQAKCQAAEGEKCFSISGKDIRRWKTGYRAIVVADTVDCVDSADCTAKSTPPNATFVCSTDQGEVASFDDKANWPALDFIADSRSDQGWFLWCQKEALVVDAAGSTAADAADAAEATEKTTRATKKTARQTAAGTCVQAVNGRANLTAPEIKACIDALVKQVFEAGIDVSDL